MLWIACYSSAAVPSACLPSCAQALAGMLTGRGLIASITKAPPGQRAFAVVTCTDKVGHSSWSVSAHVGDTKTGLHAATKLSTPHCTQRISTPVTTALPCTGRRIPALSGAAGAAAERGAGAAGGRAVQLKLLHACVIHGASSLYVARFAVPHSFIYSPFVPFWSPSHPSFVIQEKEARAAAEAAAAAQAAAAALQAQRNAVQAEEQALFRALQDVRKVRRGGRVGPGFPQMTPQFPSAVASASSSIHARVACCLQTVAAAAGVAPSQLCSDFALWEMVRRRPGAPAALAACQGCSELFVQRHGQVRQIMRPCFLCSNVASALACTSRTPVQRAVRLSSACGAFPAAIADPAHLPSCRHLFKRLWASARPASCWTLVTPRSSSSSSSRRRREAARARGGAAPPSAAPLARRQQRACRSPRQGCCGGLLGAGCCLACGSGAADGSWAVMAAADRRPCLPSAGCRSGGVPAVPGPRGGCGQHRNQG